ncbi:MAG TPA: 2-C-methyl-D-erythritol 4-phosphate cytidylyltransferase [Peptococcaceae bacterium]|nr:2-C-methyl-D-erythritol 4-phosphate cytidylyltransferase [Peptococcaceae bacterium]HQD54769.1 2-C-methyl-D-erythritol 4-phosphate cytidylyltransferase [Peptococcaceae bacterium]
MGKVTALIPCAGQGKRMGGRVSKQFLRINDRPLLAYTLAPFQKHPLIDDIILVTREEDIPFCWEEIVQKEGFSKVSQVVAGGQERQDSVYQGLLALDKETDWVVIHDGARPMISWKTINAVLEAAVEKGAAIVGVPAKDTIKLVNPDLTVQDTPPRELLWHIQTPQVFRKTLVLKAYQEAIAHGWQGTDDASLVEKLGVPVYVVQGEYTNIKITTPEDFAFLFEALRGQVKK